MASTSPLRALGLLVPESDGESQLRALWPADACPSLSTGGRVTVSRHFQEQVFVAGQLSLSDDHDQGNELERTAAANGFLSHLALPVRGHAAAGEPRAIIGALVVAYGERGAASRAPVELLLDITDALGEGLERNLDEEEQQKRLVQAERLAMLGTLAGGVAHEINNPAAFITLGIGLLERTLHGRDVRMEGKSATIVKDLLLDLRASTQRIVAIGDDLRSFTKYSSNDLSRRVPVDVGRSIETALSLTRGQIVDRAQLELRLLEVPAVLMAEGRLAQVVVNLLINATQAIPKGGPKQGPHRHVVTVETRSDGQTVEIEVSDTGAPIPAEKMSRLWEPLSTVRSSETGSGLGLFVSRQIVERAGGTIRVESPAFSGGLSSEPHGSRFVIVLPVEESDAAPAEVAVAKPRHATRIKLLIVEDEAPLARALADHLRRFHAVTLASNGEEALALLAEGRSYDVVMCDLRMPGMSGEAFYAHLATSKPELLQGLIFMTGVGFGDNVERFLRDSGRPLLEKPFTAEQALKVIDEVHAKRGA